MPSSARMCFAMEAVIPQLLCRTYPEWEKEGLDGFFVARARKTGPAAVELVGTCILITDQTVTPFMITLEASPSGEAIASYRLNLGEPGSGHLGISVARCNSKQASELLALLTTRLDCIAWSYTIASDGG